MAWHTPQLEKGQRPKHLGIKPTKADHAQIKAWCLMGVFVEEMCVRMGEQYGLGRPMAKATFYYHFRQDLPIKQKPGFKAKKKKTVSRLDMQTIESEMARMLSTVAAHKSKPRDESEDED
jgi:hypothetical protein